MGLTKREIVSVSHDGLTMVTSEVDGKPHRLELAEPLRAAETASNAFYLTDAHIVAIVEYAAAMKLGYNRRSKPRKARAKKADATGNQSAKPLDPNHGLA